jgi:hypothetical protein
MTLFGSIITDDQVEDAVMAVLKTWTNTELAEVERQTGVSDGEPPYYARPESWLVRNDMEKWPEEALPAVIVISTGTADEPRKDGSKRYTVPFAIGVACVVGAPDQEHARRFAYRLGAALRAALIHHQSLDGALDGRVRGVSWLASRNNEMPPEDGRTIWATRQVFVVEVEDVLTQSAGPARPEPPRPTPPEQREPYGDWPAVEPGGASVDLTREDNP